MNIATLLFNDLYSCPLRLLLDGTGIYCLGVQGPGKCVICNLRLPFKWFFLRLILTMKAVGIPEFGPFPYRLYFLGGTMRLGLVRRCRLIKFIVAILANYPPEIRFRMK